MPRRSGARRCTKKVCDFMEPADCACAELYVRWRCFEAIVDGASPERFARRSARCNARWMHRCARLTRRRATILD